MFNVGSGEILVILLVALIVLGPAQLPKAARTVGNAMAEIRKISTGFQRELTSALEAEERKATEKPVSPGGPTDRTAEPDADADADDPLLDEPVDEPLDEPLDEPVDDPADGTA